MTLQEALRKIHEAMEEIASSNISVEDWLALMPIRAAHDAIYRRAILQVKGEGV